MGFGEVRRGEAREGYGKEGEKKKMDQRAYVCMAACLHGHLDSRPFQLSMLASAPVYAWPRLNFPLSPDRVKSI